jgi:GMP synthase (glutamine-hydrolysing)
MKRALLIRHIAFEDGGSLIPVLEERGFACRYFEAGMKDFRHLNALDDDLVVSLGGPISVNDKNLFPFLGEERQLLEKRLRADRPTLGICLGAQLMATALGGTVGPGTKEIGWSKISLTPQGSDSALLRLDTPVLHWHGETFSIPEGATRLAYTEACQNQAFAFGRRALGLQFHPEATPRGLERWYIGHIGEIAQTPGVSVPELRRATEIHGPALIQAATKFWNSWLDDVL